MTSIEKPCIVDCLEWRDQTCACGRHVDVRWIAHRGDQLAKHDIGELLFHNCPTCVLKNAPAEMRRRLEARYEYMRQLLIELGFAGEQQWVGPSMQTFFRTPNQPAPTLTGWSWYQQVRDERGSRTDVYAFAGTLPVAIGEPFRPSDFSDYPACNVEPVRATAKSNVWVFVAIDVFHPDARPGVVHLRIRARRPTLPYSYSVAKWNRLTETQMATLTRESLSMLRNVRNLGGAPSLESDKDGIRAELLTLADRWNAERGSAPRRIEDFCVVACKSPTALRHHIRVAGFGTWANYKRRFLVGAQSRRSARTIRR